MLFLQFNWESCEKKEAANDLLRTKQWVFDGIEPPNSKKNPNKVKNRLACGRPKLTPTSQLGNLCEIPREPVVIGIRSRSFPNWYVNGCLVLTLWGFSDA
jgi:hypothetical protein